MTILHLLSRLPSPGLSLGVFLLPIAAAAVTHMGARWYHGFAERHGIVAHLNARTLHSDIVPRGAGIVFGIVFVVSVVLAGAFSLIESSLLAALSLGGFAATVAGFVDDKSGISALRKLAIHAGLAVFLLLVWYSSVYQSGLETLTPVLRVCALLFLLFVPLWLINVYNFIDGVDGLAASGAVFICGAIVIVLWLAHSDASTILAVGLLGACCLGFLPLNLPPARMFMGDAGSIFLGYCVSSLAIWTILHRQVSIWTWIVVLAYYLGDTTTTTLFRIVLVRKWYGVHRSHAYQNLARVLQSHARVTYGVLLYNMCWLLPLAVMSTLRPQFGPTAAALGIVPVVLWTVRFGPRYSRD